MRLDPKKGTASPLGVMLLAKGANVAVWSANATKITLCVFDVKTDAEIFRCELAQRLGDVHFGFIEGLKAGMVYGLRVAGPWTPEQDQLFDDTKLVLDPYAKEINRAFVYHGRLGVRGVDTATLVPKAVVTQVLPDLPLRSLREPDFIYELNVKALTKLHPDIPETQRGTVAALAHPAIIQHLQKIGVDTIELMPITAWIDERHLGPLGLHNAWGYNPVSFFAIDPRLAPGGVDEVRDTVAKLHGSGFNVILDMVFNHSGESDLLGPTLSFRGLDNSSYYRYKNGVPVNDTGCGNTLALDHPQNIAMVIASLRHWVLQCGIDGFRFDLAPIMGRDDKEFNVEAALFKAIEADPVLSTRIMIAEPWDVGPGGYQLGNFPPRWLEWNDKFRDDIRRYWRGDYFSANALATRIAGSSDEFQKKSTSTKTLNFIAAHDGFTLRDLVSFKTKNNFANGEDNRDGKNGEVTWVPGDVRALLATLFLSRGTLMLTAGDEFGRTQKGNNNAYAQDNDITWLDWKNADDALIIFVAGLARLRKSLPLFTERGFLDASSTRWFGKGGGGVSWNDPANRLIGMLHTGGDVRHALVFNGGLVDEVFPLAGAQGLSWQRLWCSNPIVGCPALSVCVFVESGQASTLGISTI